MAHRKWHMWVGWGLVVLGLSACTDNPDSLHPPPVPAPSVQIVRVEETRPQEVPETLRGVYKLRCAACHAEDGHSGSGGDLYHVGHRTAKNWEKFLRNPQSIQPGSRMSAVTGLTNEETHLLAEWLSKITRPNPRPKAEK